MNTTPWTNRPIEEARLLNPAFLGELIAACSDGYEQQSDRGLPYALAFVVAPIVLHRSTREVLPGTTRTSLGSWLARNPRVHVGFAERAGALVPFVKEAILFAAGGGEITVAETRLLATHTARARSRRRQDMTDEVRACIERSGFVGRWFARSGDYTTIMTLWGVTP